MVQHIDIKVYPEALIRHPIERVADTLNDSSRTDRQRLENVDPVDGSAVYVGPCEIFIAVFAFAKLDNVNIFNKRAGYTGPFGR